MRLVYENYETVGKEESMNVISCAASMRLQSYSEHSHNCWELVYHLNGEADTSVGKDRFSASEGSVYLIPPCVPHSGVSRGFFRDFSVKMKETGFRSFVLLKDRNNDILTLLFMLQRVMTERREGYGAAADAIFEPVCALIKTEIELQNETPAVRKLREMLYDNIADPSFRIKDAAEKCGFDKDHLRRLFKREIGKTPIEYLTDLRITRAKQLLERSADITVAAVAESVGFADSLYFSTCFKKKVGTSPTEYRSRAKI